MTKEKAIKPTQGGILDHPVENSFTDNTALTTMGGGQITTLTPISDPVEAAGVIKAFETMTAFASTMGVVQLVRIKETYESGNIPEVLKDQYGPNFRTFCGKVGIPWETARKKVRNARGLSFEMLQMVEALSLPMSTLRQVRNFSDEQKRAVHQFLMSGEGESKEIVKDYIGQLQAENTRLEQLAGADKAMMEIQVEGLKENAVDNTKLIKELKKSGKVQASQIKGMTHGHEAEQILEQFQQLKQRYHTLKDLADPEIQPLLDTFRDMVEDLAQEKRS